MGLFIAFYEIVRSWWLDLVSYEDLQYNWPVYIWILYFLDDFYLDWIT